VSTSKSVDCWSLRQKICLWVQDAQDYCFLVHFYPSLLFLSCGCSSSVNTAGFSVFCVIVELKTALTLWEESFVYSHSKCRVFSFMWSNCSCVIVDLRTVNFLCSYCSCKTVDLKAINFLWSYRSCEIVDLRTISSLWSYCSCEIVDLRTVIALRKEPFVNSLQ